MNTPDTEDLTKEEAFYLLRGADKESNFSHTIATNETRIHYDGYEPGRQQFSVIVTAPKDQHAAQNIPTLREAVETVIAKMNQPASVKAAALRAQAAEILAKAEQLEAQP